MTVLLDVNVIIALIDPWHVEHRAAHVWFDDEGCRSWATCPIVENGVIRIVGNPKYPNWPGSPAMAAGVLAKARHYPGHVFWPDELSLVSAPHIDVSGLLTSAQVTDTYLLALAVSRGGRFATFDRRLSTKAVTGGRSALMIIGDR